MADDHRDSLREFGDALPRGAVRGRGAGLQPGNRFETVRLHVLGEHLDEVARENAECGRGAAQVRTFVGEDSTRSIINPVDSPDLGFSWTINPYRGCEHGCIYCYARPGHEYLGLSCGLDFETRIFAKPEAPALLRRELAAPSWKGEVLVMSGVTDPYQPAERELEITRACLSIMAECRQAVSIITKNRMVTRDLDLLAPMARLGLCRIAISITTLDNDLAAKMEPRASSPAARLAAVRDLAAAGVPVMVMTAPIIPGLNDREIPALLAAAADAGATSAGWIMLRLPFQIKALFLDWLARSFPDRAAHVESLLRQVRSGGLSDPRFFSRHRGEGPIADQIAKAFKVFRKRSGLDRPLPRLNTALFRRPEAIRGQLTLFD